MRIRSHARSALMAAALVVAGCGGGSFAISFGDGSDELRLTVDAPTRIETGHPVPMRPGGLLHTGGLRFEWDFGDGSGLRFEIEPTHAFDRAGSYTIVLVVSDGRDRVTANLRVEVGAWSIVDGRPCTASAFGGWCLQPAPGGTSAALDGLWFVDTRRGVAREAGGDLWRTADGGRSWSWTGPTARAEFAADGTGWDLRGGTLWRSDDLGLRWQALPQPAGRASAAQFVDRQRGWLQLGDCPALPAGGCRGALQRTADGGQQWQPATLPASGLRWRFADGRQGVATDGRSAAWWTDDGGDRWSPAAVAFGGRATTLERLVFADAQTGWMLLGETDGRSWLLRTADGGRSWTAPQPLPGSRIADLAFGDARNGWAVGDGGQIWATRDGGLSWQAQASGTTQALRAVAAFDSQTAWAAGVRGTLLATATGGR